ncbi:protease SohB [Amphritea japonica]|uniref:Serine protease SohB n=1 Tax=Amphritea japonica ATCC BAA-1530 TaxID=1278309 RepID=A0A7R6SSX3_9GAMM|nr:protease SohB [Amphritea japonica]BBB26070.1 serine protease SohB [Amphritea japonica ATCC BAA-1530]
MVDFLASYGLFLAKALTVVGAIIMVIVVIGVVASRNKKDHKEGYLSVNSLNETLEDMEHALKEVVLDADVYKQQLKDEEKQDKADAKARKKALKKGKVEQPSEPERKRVFVLDFDGDIKASELEPMREEITAVLTMATEKDEVVVRLESPGGMVHSYGLASSQLERIKRHGVPLTVCVDRVAASGGYMMACLADKIIAAPFSILGSIGVVAQLPNFHRLLQKHDIDYEILTAGEYKRTMTVMGENTEKGREKFIEDLEDTHSLFKEFVAEYRPQVDMEKVATGEVWFGRRALSVNLIDEILTSDEYLAKACEEADVYSVRYEYKKTLQDRISEMSIKTTDSLFTKWVGRILNVRLLAK